MGKVYLAEDRRLGRRVAIKLLHAEFTTDAERVARFAQEARTASALNHPNIITIYEIGETERTLYIVTEYIEGETLRQRMNAGSMKLLDCWRRSTSPFKWRWHSKRLTVPASYIATSNRKT